MNALLKKQDVRFLTVLLALTVC